MRILEFAQPKELEKLMQGIKVDPYGIKIMAPKALNYLIKLNAVSHTAANILKQEMLSLGADAAIAKDAITGKVKKTDCLLIANFSQLRSLHTKLSFQPFGLAELAQDLSSTLNNYQKNNFSLRLAKFELNLKAGRVYLMGVINLTPDSFSGDGMYSPSLVPHPSSLNRIIEYADQLVKDGADIIDIGGESTRPGSKPISVKEELRRILPTVKTLAKKIKIPISIDTYKPEVAQVCLDCGASLINDISGLKSSQMAKAVARYKAGIVIMHMKGKPASMQNNPKYASLIDDIVQYLEKAVNSAVSSGISREQIIIDPGIGFGKSLEHNLGIFKRLKEFKILGQPLLVGPSRKSFIGKILRALPQERQNGTLAACVFAGQNGANILRVHDVKAVKDALKITERINNQ